MWSASRCCVHKGCKDYYPSSYTGDPGVTTTYRSGVTIAAPGTRPARAPQAKCPLRPGEPCTLCQLDVTGPQDCPLVFLVMGDDELRAAWATRRRAQRSR